jgi:sigma-B regulation protein RsbU (phosphoserine phosphatase)
MIVISHNLIKEDIKLFETIALQVWAKYENIVLTQKVLENKILQKELEITKRIQESLLSVSFPSVEEFEVYAKTIPAKLVGGDFYDIIELQNGKYGVIIGDVSGKSIPAALFMAVVLSTLRSLIRDIQNPRELFHKANHIIYEYSADSGMFATIFYALIDTKNKEIRFTTAGHNPQIFIQKDGKVEFLKSYGKPLGILPKEKANFGEGTIKYNSGDTLFLYTDGIVEAFNNNGEEYGEKRLVSFLQKHKETSLQELFDKLWTDVISFTGGDFQTDDFTAVIVKFS